MTNTPTPPLKTGEPKQAQIVRLVRNAIDAGTIGDGEVLPSTRDLAQRWDVSVYTINEAMGTLADQGYVQNLSRSKRVAKDPNPNNRPAKPARTSPVIIFVGGYAGSGKTEFGRVLARRTGWPIIDKDTTTRPVVELALEALGLPGHDRESDAYLNQIRPREYEALIATMNENADCGVSAIMTAPFVREYHDVNWLNRISASIHTKGARTVYVWIRCDADTMHTYIRQRGAARDAAKLADWSGYLSKVDLDFAPPVPHVLVHNGADAESLQDQAERLLNSLSQASE